MSYCTEPDNHSNNKIKLVLDWSNYFTEKK